MRNRAVFILLISVLMLTGLFGCAEKPCYDTFFTMDTFVEATVYGTKNEAVLDEIRALTLKIENELSVTKTGSFVYKLNNSAGKWCEISEDLHAIISGAKEMFTRSGGLFDISIYPVVRAYGFTIGEYRLPGKEELEALLENTGADRIELKEEDGAKYAALPSGFAIDLGGCAKGYTLDKISEMIESKGVSEYMVSLGGCLALGEKPSENGLFNIAVADPFEPEKYLGTIALKSCKIVTSGAYQRNFEAEGVVYHHIIDPRTGRPSQSGLASVTVVGESGFLCDELSTTLFIMGLDSGIEFLKEFDGYGAIFVTENREICVSSELFEGFEIANSGYAVREIE